MTRRAPPSSPSQLCCPAFSHSRPLHGAQRRAQVLQWVSVPSVAPYDQEVAPQRERMTWDLLSPFLHVQQVHPIQSAAAARERLGNGQNSVPDSVLARITTISKNHQLHRGLGRWLWELLWAHVCATQWGWNGAIPSRATRWQKALRLGSPSRKGWVDKNRIQSGKLASLVKCQ